LLLPPTEFAALQEGLTQCARLPDAVLTDRYGPQSLLSSGLLPPALVHANPGCLRPCCSLRRDASVHPLQFDAADLVRDADGAWRVVSDHTGSYRVAGWPGGIARDWQGAEFRFDSPLVAAYERRKRTLHPAFLVAGRYWMRCSSRSGGSCGFHFSPRRNDDLDGNS
jgi:hypothetical protein